jgi:hypothetical protein
MKGRVLGAVAMVAGFPIFVVLVLIAAGAGVLQAARGRA